MIRTVTPRRFLEGMCSVTAVRVDSSSPCGCQRPETPGQPADVYRSIQAPPSTFLAGQGESNIPREGYDQRLRWSAWVWSPPPESNRRPHPYHGTTRNSCAKRHLPRSRLTVDAKVMRSLDATLCVLPKVCRPPRMRRSFPPLTPRARRLPHAGRTLLPDLSPSDLTP